jgi:outer membrane protein assembly factor BamB
MKKRLAEILIGVTVAVVLAAAIGAGTALGARRGANGSSALRSVSATPAPSAEPTQTPAPTPTASPVAPAPTPASPTMLPSVQQIALPRPQHPSPPTAVPTPRPAPRPARPTLPGDWTQPGYDAGGSDYNSADSSMPASQLPGLRQVGGGYGNGYGSVVTDGVIYSSEALVLGAHPLDCPPDRDGNYFCRLWTYDIGNPAWGPNSNQNSAVGVPAVADGRVFASVNVSEEGWMYAFDSAGCAASPCPPLWKAQLAIRTNAGGGTQGSTESSPVVAGGIVYDAATVDNSLRAFSVAGCGAPICAPLWIGNNVATTNPPVVGDGMVYVNEGWTVAAFRAGGCGAPTCDPVWRTRLPATQLSITNLALSGGRVFVTHTDGRLSALDAGTGALLWSVATGTSELRAAPMAVGGTVFVGATYALQARDAATGTLLWSGGVPGGASAASPTGADGVVYVDAGNNDLYAFPVAGCGSPMCSAEWTNGAAPPQQQLANSLGGSEGPVVAEGHLVSGSTVLG